MVNDPFVFGNTADLTTKDILKRYQDRMGQRPGLGEVNEVFNRPDNSSRPPPRRVETDPALWQQQESSVRTVQEPPMPIPPFNQTNPGTPPQRWRPHEENGHPSPYGGSQYEHSDTEGPSEAQKREWRQSGGVWGRQNSGVGVGGNT